MPRSRQLSLFFRRALLMFPVLLVMIVVLVALLTTRMSAPAQAQDGRPTPTPLPLYALPDARSNRAYSSGSFALSQQDGVTIAAANALKGSVTIAVPVQNRVDAEIQVGRDPRGVAITPDGSRAIIANRGDGTVSIVDIRSATVINTLPVGVWPYGVVAGSDQWAYVSLQGSGEIAEIDLASARVSRRFSAPGMPSGLALWGDFLYVTHFWTGELSLVYIPSGQIVARVSTGAYSSISQGITLDITRGTAYLPQTLSNPTNLSLTYDSAALPVINTVDLRTLTMNRSERIALDRVVRPVNMPFDLAFDRFARRLYVVSAGSDSLSVIDLDDGRVRAHVAVGSSPRRVLLNRDNTLVYVHSVFEGTLTTIQTSNLAVLDVLPLTSSDVATEVLIGSRLFYSAVDTRMSREQWLSCATCHFDGMSDGRVWDRFTDGPRNTPVLFGLVPGGSFTGSGRWDELADLEIKIRRLQAGTGLTRLPAPHSPDGSPHAGLSADLDALVGYILGLQGPVSPFAGSQGSELAARGQEVFEAKDCLECHSGSLFSDAQVVDVGTGLSPLEQQGTRFRTPSLRWLWLSAPYFHDGSAPTLRDVFTLPGAHQLIRTVSQEDIDALIAYLLSLPQS
jgi:YVTN family beta-propeller protein